MNQASNKIVRHGQRKLSALCLLLVICTAGCGQTAAEKEEMYSAEGKERKEYDLTAEEWQNYSEAVDKTEVWSVAAYWDDSEIEPPANTEEMNQLELCHAFGRQKYYMLEGFYREADADGRIAQKCYLTCLDLLTFEASRAELDFQAAQEAASDTVSEAGKLAEIAKDSRFRMMGMDVSEDQPCLLAAIYEDEEITRICVIELDKEWKIVRLTELTQELSQADLFLGGMSLEGIRLDREGRIYLMADEGIALFDAEGAFLAWVEAPSGMLACTYSLPDGRPVFEYCSGTAGLVIFCVEGLEKKILYQSACAYVDTRHVNQYGDLFYMDSGELRRWNAVEGSCEVLYRDMGIRSMSCRAISETQEGEIVLVLSDLGGFILLKLHPDEKGQERVVTIYQLSVDDEITRHAEEYTRKHPGIRMEVTSINQDEGISLAFNQLMARLSMGEGPDLLVVQRQQLEALQDNGVLADLTKLLPDEVTRQIFSGVLRYGMIEEKLYGVACRAAVTTLAVSKERWGKRSWTYQDVMDLINQAEKKGSCIEVFAHYGAPATSDELLFDLVLRDLPTGNSPFADLEQKTCCFDTENFTEVLKFCKTYGQEPGGAYRSDEERVEAVRASEALALAITGNLATFSQGMAMLGEGYQCVGYPVGGEDGTFLEFYSCIGINEASPNQDVASDFLLYLLSKEVQRQIGVAAVRRDVLTEYVKDGESGKEEPYFVLGDALRIPLAGKEDGTSFLAEYVELMGKGMPSSVWMDDMQTIVTEEAAMYFAGDRSAEDTAAVIQSRIQLYMDERQ